MIDFEYLPEVVQPSPTKIVMVVVDGLGGMKDPNVGKTELEMAHLPNLDFLTTKSSCGVSTPVLPGITPGSGPGHMALFGYDPVKYLLGRGILEGFGIGAEIGTNDVAARGNLCTLKDDGNILDRRANRIRSNQAIEIINLLNRIKIDNVSITVLPVIDYRFVLVINGPGLSSNISETDPQMTGIPIAKSLAKDEGASFTASVVNEFTDKANNVLKNRNLGANGVLLRGFSGVPTLPSFCESYSLNAGAIASYPMYKGIAELIGMEILGEAKNFKEEIDVLKANYDSHDFFFVHYKPADSAGEDGDFRKKVETLEEFDGFLKEIIKMSPDVLVVCGDHSTPSFTSSHSWHPVPFLINSKYGDGYIDTFDESSCLKGSLGRIKAEELMLLIMAHADKLTKFGP